MAGFRYFSVFIFLCYIFSLAFAKAENSAWKCEAITDVLQASLLDSYEVTDKTYFHEPCINKDGLCSKGSYVVKEDIVLAGKIKIGATVSDHWCAAYIPSSYLLPRAIGWFLDISNLQAIDKQKYQDMIGEWGATSLENDYLKTLSINVFPEEENVSIYGQSISRHAPEGSIGHIMDGVIFMTGQNRYIAIANDAQCVSDIVEREGRISLKTRGSCGETNNYNDFSDHYTKIIPD